jgi:8-amino-7-oxononanoate synthase
LGGAGQALALQQHLRTAGIVAPAIRPPTVPPGSARLRLSLTANHRPQDLDRFWQALDGWQD